jgi:hypothetical protein
MGETGTKVVKTDKGFKVYHDFRDLGPSDHF